MADLSLLLVENRDFVVMSNASLPRHNAAILHRLQTSRSGSSAATPREPLATTFPETIPEETSSIEEEHVMIFRLDSLPEEEDDEAQRRPKVYKVSVRSGHLMAGRVVASDVSDVDR